MSVETVGEHDPGTRTASGGPLCCLLSVPRDYPVGWAIGWTILLLSLTLAPARILPEKNVLPTKGYMSRSDLAVHFTLFLGFAWSWMRATRWRYRWVVIVTIGLFLALGTEWTQGIPFVDRDPAVSDATADCVGVAVGLAGAVIFRSSPAAKPWADRSSK